MPFCRTVFAFEWRDLYPYHCHVSLWLTATTLFNLLWLEKLGSLWHWNESFKVWQWNGKVRICSSAPTKPFSLNCLEIFSLIHYCVPFDCLCESNSIDWSGVSLMKYEEKKKIKIKMHHLTVFMWYFFFSISSSTSFSSVKFTHLERIGAFSLIFGQTDSSIQTHHIRFEKACLTDRQTERHSDWKLIIWICA